MIATIIRLKDSTLFVYTQNHGNPLILKILVQTKMCDKNFIFIST